MKRIYKAAALLAAIKRAAPWAQKKSTIQATQNTVRISDRAECVNADGGIRVPVESTGDGAAIVDLPTLTASLGAWPTEEIEIRSKSAGWTELARPGESPIHRLKSHVLTDWPSWPEMEEGPAWRAEDWGELLRPVLHAVCTDETRYNLLGVHLEASADAGAGLAAVATDGHRLAMHIGRPGEGQGTILLPSLLARELSRLGSAELQTSGAQAALRTEEGIEIRSVLIDGRFPDWRKILPEWGKVKPKTAEVVHEWGKVKPKTAEVVHEELVALIRRVTAANKGEAALAISVSSEGLRLTSKTADGATSTDSIPCDWSERETFTIGANAGYLADAARATGGESIRFRFEDSLSAFQIDGGSDDGPQQIVMPMRV